MKCKWALIAYAMIWFAVGIAVSVAIIVLKSILPLLFLIIPACVGLHINDDGKDKEG